MVISCICEPNLRSQNTLLSLSVSCPTVLSIEKSSLQVLVNIPTINFLLI